MAHPATEWLFARLGRSPGVANEVTDEAFAIGITPAELTEALKANRVVNDHNKPASRSDRATVWSLPPAPEHGFRKGYDPRRFSHPEPVVATDLVRADAVLVVKRHSPKQRVEVAKDRLRRRAPRYVQYLDDLARKASEDAPACPTCGRGTPRSEEVRLRAVVAALDRSGVTPPRSDDGDGAPSGPVIVFPPGTAIAVLVQTPSAPPSVVESYGPRITRGDELGV